jgi:hypothetical protein
MVAGSNAELLYQVLQLVQEQPGSEIGALVAQMGGAAAAELIVLDDGASAFASSLKASV